MIKVFGQKDKVFSSNGDAIIKPLYASVHKEDNGDYYLDLEAGLEYIDYLVAGNIIVANTPQGEQAFRITNPEKTKNKISFRAYHVYYDSLNYLIEDSYVVDKNCNDALDHLNRATTPTSEFTVSSDVGSTNSYRCVRTSLYEAIDTVIERWGGHLVRDNFNIEIRTVIGSDYGVTVQYKKNLKEITCEENWDDVVTKLLPVGKDGILLNAINPSASKYVESEISYEIPYTKTVSFSQDSILQEDYADETAYKEALVADLKQQALAYVDEHSLPEVNYTLEANLDRITDIGDVVEVIDERLGVNLLTYVIAYDYNCILEKYTEIEFGNFKQSLSGLVSNITASVDKTVTEKTETAISIMNTEIKQATASIMKVLESGYVIYDGDKILVVDNLPKEEAVNVIRINSYGLGFSQNGIYGTYETVWTIDGTLDMSKVHIINLVADLIKGGTYKLGNNENTSGTLKIYDEANVILGQISSDGIQMYGHDGSCVAFDTADGFAGYDINNNLIFYISNNEFHMKKSNIEEEVTLFDKMRYLPIQVTDSSNNIVNDGIGLMTKGDL